MLLSLQLLPCWWSYGELLMACGVQTVVPTTATGQAYSTPSSKNYTKTNSAIHSCTGCIVPVMQSLTVLFLSSKFLQKEQCIM